MANVALIAYLAKARRPRKANVTIIFGERARMTLIHLAGDQAMTR